MGETLEQYEAGSTTDVVRRQIRTGLAGIDSDSAPRIVVAYEPVWAIGTGKASSGENANFVHQQVIRPALSDLFGAQLQTLIRILYGGSVTASNASEFFAYADIDGALVGGQASSRMNS